jgi:hypothetical protein
LLEIGNGILRVQFPKQESRKEKGIYGIEKSEISMVLEKIQINVLN